MTEIKLGKLPDRTPIKLTFNASPDLKQALDDYAEIYRQTYAADEPIVELIPFMLESFLAADRAFLKARATLRNVAG